MFTAKPVLLSAYYTDPPNVFAAYYDSRDPPASACGADVDAQSPKRAVSVPWSLSGLQCF